LQGPINSGIIIFRKGQVGDLSFFVVLISGIYFHVIHETYLIGNSNVEETVNCQESKTEKPLNQMIRGLFISY